MDHVNAAVAWLTSEHGRLACALLLFAAVALLERTPGIRQWLHAPAQKRALAVILAAVPALAVVFEDVGAASAAVETALTALLGATGLNAMLPGKLIGLGGPRRTEALRRPS